MDPSFLKIWVLKLVKQHQQTLIVIISFSSSSFLLLSRYSGASFQIHAVNYQNMNRERCSLKVCPFCATVAAQHGIFIEVE